jgi:hypothetical protein
MMGLGQFHAIGKEPTRPPNTKMINSNATGSRKLINARYFNKGSRATQRLQAR